ncbi:restriction endonuclease subunit S [Clostridium celatum]|uniref:restriction endonuclease subunit S n=1 Tax=Clostridium celatum TaxID=36834 RepID=UPI001F3B54DE|nr:restriction endonuclease subunit S [Clostridium celatum]MCE9654722.1 restriction endonuclease subunit S [Clostridium celatum]
MRCKNFDNYKLGELVEISSSKRIYAKEYVGYGIPFYRGKEIIEKHKGNDISTELYITEERYNELKEKFGVPNAGDILLTSVGTLGVPYLVKDEEFYFKDGNLTWFKSFNQKCNNKFIYYWLQSPFAKEQIYNRCIGSTQKALTIDTLKKFDIKLPSLREQKEIVNLLSALDRKIELNNEMNKTLEEIAQALFKRWFVDFEFPNENGEPYKSSGGEMVESELGIIPKGWEIGYLSDLVDSISVKHKFNKDKIIFLNTSDILDGEVLTNEYSDVAALPGQAKKSIQKNDILYSEIRPKNKRYAFVDFECEDYVVSTKLMVLRAKSILSPTLIYQFLTSSDTVDYLQSIAESRSGTFPQITFKELEKLKIALPEQETLLKWNNSISSLFYNIQENKRENKSLIELRDILLPKLMSGEIIVEDIEANL